MERASAVSSIDNPPKKTTLHDAGRIGVHKLEIGLVDEGRGAHCRIAIPVPALAAGKQAELLVYNGKDLFQCATIASLEVCKEARHSSCWFIVAHERSSARVGPPIERCFIPQKDAVVAHGWEQAALVARICTYNHLMVNRSSI